MKIVLHCSDVLPKPSFPIPEEALRRGRWVHAVTAAEDLFQQRGAGVPEVTRWLRAAFDAAGDCAAEWYGYCQSWQLARQQLGIEVLAVEEPVEDVARGYVGTLDRRCTIRGRRGDGAVELKCCAAGTGTPPPTTGLQLAGYVGERKLWRGACVLHPASAARPYQWRDDRTDNDPITGLFRPYDWREFNDRLRVAQADIQRGFRPMPRPREGE